MYNFGYRRLLVVCWRIGQSSGMREMTRHQIDDISFSNQPCQLSRMREQDLAYILHGEISCQNGEDI